MANRAPRIDIPDDDALAPGEALLELPLSDESAGRVVVRWDGGDIELTAARYGLLIAGMDDGGELRAFAMRIPSNQVELIADQLRGSEGGDGEG